MDAVQDNFEHSNKLECPFTPYMVIFHLLFEIEKDLPAYTSSKMLSFDNKATDTLTWMDFLVICKEIKDQAASLQSKANNMISAATSANSNNGSKSPNNNGRSNHFSQNNNINHSKHCNTPPNGMKAKEWINTWQNNPTNQQDGCFFCNSSGHNATTCYYLVPDCCPEGWTSHTDL